MSICSNKKATRPVLFIQHTAQEHPALMKRVLEARGIAVQMLHPYLGDPYPEPKEISGLISLGGPMGANDERFHSWIPEECFLLKQCLRQKVPVLGICLGAQLLAKTAGAKVRKNEQPELGWFPVTLKPAAAHSYLSGLGKQISAYHWHNDTFEIPAGADWLASSAACQNQAFQIEDYAYGVQFHPEADKPLLKHWLTDPESSADIVRAEEEHGSATIQSADTQIRLASRGEIANAKLTTALSFIFGSARSKKSLLSSRPLSHLPEKNLISEWMLKTGTRQSRKWVGRLVGDFNSNGVDFLLLRDTDQLLWPIPKAAITPTFNR